MKKIYVGLLLLGYLFATYNCNRSSAKPKMEDTSIEMYEQLNEMEEEIIREGELFNGSKVSPVGEGAEEEKLIYEDYSALE